MMKGQLVDGPYCGQRTPHGRDVQGVIELFGDHGAHRYIRDPSLELARQSIVPLFAHVGPVSDD